MVPGDTGTQGPRVCNGPLTRHVKLLDAHAPGMSGTFSPQPRINDPDMYHGTCVTPVPWCMPGSLTSGFLWSRWRRKLYRHSRRMRNPQFYVSGNRSMVGFSRHILVLAASFNSHRQSFRFTTRQITGSELVSSLLNVVGANLFLSCRTLNRFFTKDEMWG